MFIDQSISRIRAYRISQGWTISRLAREAGLNESTIRNIDSDDCCPTIKTLRALERIVPEGWHEGVAA